MSVLRRVAYSGSFQCKLLDFNLVGSADVENYQKQPPLSSLPFNQRPHLITQYGDSLVAGPLIVAHYKLHTY